MGVELAKAVGYVGLVEDVPLSLFKTQGLILLGDEEVDEHRVISPKIVAYALLDCAASIVPEFTSTSFSPSIDDPAGLAPDVPLAKVTCIMAQRNLLDYTQVILESVGESVVDTIDETTASLQAARIIREVYFEGMANRNWPHKYIITAFQPFGIDFPTHVSIPTNVKQIDTIYYNRRRDTDTRDKYLRITYLQPEDFLRKLNTRDSSADNIETVLDVDGGKLFIRNDLSPTWWTSFNQDQVVFDSYDSAIEATIQASKQQIYVVKNPEFCIEDDFIPDIPEEAMPWLIAESKSVAAVEMNQDANQKAEQQSQRQSKWLSRRARVAGKAFTKPTYGRSSIKSGTRQTRTGRRSTT